MPKRLIAIFLFLTIFFALPLLILGNVYDVRFSGESGISRLKEYGHFAWAIGMGLIVVDLVLPIPATAIMSALGYLYGAVLGGLAGGTGSMIAGLIAYFSTRLMGRRAAVFLAGEKDLNRVEKFFARRGALAVAITRPMPILPEVTSCLAGMAGMPLRIYVISLACGSLSTGFVFATVGALGVSQPWVAIVASYIVPLLLYAIAYKWIHHEHPH